MASGLTNRGKFLIGGRSYVGTTIPTNYYAALLSDTTTPDVDDNVMSDLSQVPAGNGYTDGGIQLSPGATDFDVHTEDDTNDWGMIQIRDLVWTASGGNLPSSGNGARWMVLTDDNATVANRQVEQWYDLVSNRTVSDTQALTIQNAELRFT